MLQSMGSQSHRDRTGQLNNNNKTGIEDNITLIVDVNLKNSHSLKVESYVLFGGNLLDFKPKRSHLSSPERAALRRIGGN